MFIFIFFTGIHELFSMLYEDKCSMADSCWLEALGGMLLALSSKGDIIYLTENVSQQLGFHQVNIKFVNFFFFCYKRQKLISFYLDKLGDSWM
jgi:hypothetical protein